MASSPSTWSAPRAIRYLALVLSFGLVAGSCGNAGDQTLESSEQPPTTQASTSTESSESTASSATENGGQIGSSAQGSNAEPEPATEPEASDSATSARQAMVLTEEDLLTFGLSGFTLLYSDPSPKADDAAAFEPGPCNVPDVGLHSRIDTEWAGNDGVDPRIVQTVLEGDDLEYWVDAIRNLADCETLPMQLSDREVAGSWGSVVLEPDGTDSDGVSYTMSVAFADDVAVLMVVFADSAASMPDPVVVASLTAMTLSRRNF